jgi:hypothetical protein
VQGLGQCRQRDFAKLVRNDKALAAPVTNRSDIPPELQPFLKMSVA